MPTYRIAFTQHFDVEAESAEQAKRMILDNPHDGDHQTYTGWTIAALRAAEPGEGTRITKRRT